ncbi:DNA-binding SARP family transcriptional activator [Herbihabitans rhizosphaerae]|uniref:DNA-binding SARP family transcriptional activator n=1 Tax=Herbihabitans rhizosphaerae TaxID=1872711 RepID=A0A4Q7L0V5_9PSEU|nr:BTAD domain-containing putative transcriptional regulator [Herbihabitans rhizosphaerae]RZS43099.1 DNA-binding SARP family transcriptional activator [Herbihabitans rhizosphaerae]
MEFRLLGPVELHDGGRIVELGPSKQRCVLAALLSQTGRPVPTDMLIDRVWGQSPPAEPRNTLYSYLARIRRLLRGTGVEVRRSNRGYVITASPDQVDLCRFTRVAEQAGPVPLARMDAALREWRGTPLDGLSGDWVTVVRDCSHRKRVRLLTTWADAAVDAGQAAEVVERVESALDDHPHAEPLIAACLRALRAEGRVAEALEHYERARARLRDDLGERLGPKLRELHGQLLRARPASTAVPLPAAPPAQLPAPPCGFVGRTDHLAELDTVLSQRLAAVVLHGPAGIGKTALAATWAHRTAARFPDGQLYADLRDRPPLDVLSAFLRALGEPAGADVAGTFRAAVTGRRLLVLIDNASAVDQVLPLLPPDDSGSLAVITSRRPLSAPGTRQLAVEPLRLDEAVAVLVDRLGEHRVDPAAAEDLAERCGRFPLPLRIAASTLHDQPGRTLADYVRGAADVH